MTAQQPNPSPEEVRLMDRLFNTPGRRLVHLNIFRGPGPASREDVCREMNRAMDQEESGKAIVSTTFPDDTPQVNVREHLAMLLSKAPHG